MGANSDGLNPETQQPEQLEQPAEELQSEETRRQQKRSRILESIGGGNLGTMELKVAWVLNNYPETRDSDIKLQLAYWSEFEAYDGGPVYPEDLFRKTRLTSLARARATLQNDYRLFVASPEIRKKRGTLSDEERQRVLEQVAPHPLITIYADESGKTAETLIWGSVWFLHAPDTLRLVRIVRIGAQRAILLRNFTSRI